MALAREPSKHVITVSETGEPVKVRNAHWWKQQLNKICMDERLSPNRRLLATIIGIQIDAASVMDKKLYTAILLGEFVNKTGLKLYDNEDRNRFTPQTDNEKRAAKEMQDVFQAVLNAEVEGDDDAT